MVYKYNNSRFTFIIIVSHVTSSLWNKWI